MSGNLAAVRSLHGQLSKQNGRHCSEKNQTLGHVVGSCPFGNLLINARHHHIRRIIASDMEKQGYEVHEEVHTLSRRIDIIAIDRRNKKAYVIDPTVRIKFNTSQPQAVQAEKQSIYNPCCEDLQHKYNLNFPIEVIGLMVGSRGTIPTDFHSLSRPLILSKSTIYDKGSCRIPHSHLYSSFSTSSSSST
jgi:hypothetical protein